MSINDCDLCGVIPAMVTPATDDGLDVDESRLRGLTKWLLEEGAHALFACSSTGEAPLLSDDQRYRVVDIVASETTGKVPLIVGVGAMSTRKAIQHAKHAESAGAQYIIALPHHFVRVTDAELEAYFVAIADSVSVPMLVYNYPELTSGQNISAALAAKLSREHNIVGIKDSSGDLELCLRYIDECGPSFSVFTGAESLLLSLLAHGGAGTICGAANVLPSVLVRIYEYFTQGEVEAALDLQRQAVRVSALWQIGTLPAAVKAGCGVVGHPAGPPFPPVHALSNEQLETIKTGLDEIVQLPAFDGDD